MTWFARLAAGLMFSVCACSSQPAPSPALQQETPTPPNGVNEVRPPPLPAPNGPILVAGDEHTCASARDGGLECWGAGGGGQLGNGSMRDRGTPTRVLYLRDVVLAAAGSRHTCAQTARGELYCWGAGASELLLDSGGDRASPLPVRVAQGPFAAMAAGTKFTCGLSADRRATCWGVSFGDEVWHRSPEELSGADRIAAAGLLVCAAFADRTTCYAVDPDGVGLAPTDERLTPTPLPPPDEVRPQGPIVRGLAHACARTTAGVRCWGTDERGQLGAGRDVPAPWSWAKISGLKAVSLAASNDRVCAVRTNGETVCWGVEPSADNDDDDEPNRVSARLHLLPGAAPAVAIDLTKDGNPMCLLLRDGGVMCKGHDDLLSQEGPSPLKRVSGVTGAVAVGVESGLACALDSKGGVQCWHLSSDESPERVNNLPAIASLHLDAAQTCAIDRKRQLWCWDMFDDVEQPLLVRRRCRGGPRYLDQQQGEIADACKHDKPARLTNVRGVIMAGGLEMMSRFWVLFGKRGGFVYDDTEDGNYAVLRKARPGTRRQVRIYGYLEPFSLPADTQRLVGDSSAACAITRKTPTHCWGDPFGPTPTAVSLPMVPVEMAASRHNVCLRDAGGTVMCLRIGNEW